MAGSQCDEHDPGGSRWFEQRDAFTAELASFDIDQIPVARSTRPTPLTLLVGRGQDLRLGLLDSTGRAVCPCHVDGLGGVATRAVGCG
jgi:hypothetical protein